MADHQEGDVGDPSAALIFVGAFVLLIAITLYIEGYIDQATPQGTIWIIAETLLLFGLSLIPLGLVVRKIFAVRRRAAKTR